MAYTYHDTETGEQGIAGTPSSEEKAMGKAKDDRDLGELCSFEELYGDD